MELKEIESRINHRPWPLPNRKWSFYQEWNDVLFLHWKVELDELKKWVPKELEIDLFEETAWISLVIFKMERIRPRNLPPFKPISNFHEINLRTYVKANGKSGVYFLSIEANSKLSCKISKIISGLPYRYSKIDRNENEIHSTNDGFTDKLYINYSIGSAVSNATDIDSWLTERYALFQEKSDSISEFEIHHKPWPLNDLRIEKLNYHYPRFRNLLTERPDLVHYSPGVQVLAWNKTSKKR